MPQHDIVFWTKFSLQLVLINGEDISYARKFIIGEDEIKSMNVKALVDTGAYMLCINEEIQAQLKFPVAEKRTRQLANGQVIEYDVVSHVELKFKNRRTMCNAMVLPDDNEVLLGAIPMEDMPIRLPFMQIIKWRRSSYTSIKTRINCKSRPSLSCTNVIKRST